jgi:hypothetical protein
VDPSAVLAESGSGLILTIKLAQDPEVFGIGSGSYQKLALETILISIRPQRCEYCTSTYMLTVSSVTFDNKFFVINIAHKVHFNPETDLAGSRSTKSLNPAPMRIRIHHNRTFEDKLFLKKVLKFKIKSQIYNLSYIFRIQRHKR